MKTSRVTARRRFGALLLALLGLVGAVYLGSGARRTALDDAVRTVAAAMPPTPGQGAGDTAQAAVRRLVRNSSSGLVFVTVRGPDHRIVASDGAWSAWFSGLVAPATARTWRAWAYRALCADARRPIIGGARVHVGVSWEHVLVSAGPALWLTILLSMGGALIAVRESHGRAMAAPETGARRVEPVTKNRRRPGAWRNAVFTWKARLIGATSAGGHRKSAAGAGEDAGFQPIGRRASAAAKPRPARAVRTETPDTSPAAPPERRTESDMASEYSADTARPAPAARAVSVFALGRCRLGFQPIWRGVRAGLLAGGAVRFVPDDASGEGDPITIDRLLAAEARDQQAGRKLSHWIARRLTTLQANWRTLELPQVPLMVCLPDALFAFEQAETVWSEALARCQPAPGELVFCVERLPAASRALPVRWAVREASAGEQTAWYRLQSGTTGEPALERGDDDGERFLLPDMRGSAQDSPRILAARDFARLVGHCDLAPV